MKVATLFSLVATLSCVLAAPMPQKAEAAGNPSPNQNQTQNPNPSSNEDTATNSGSPSGPGSPAPTPGSTSMSVTLSEELSTLAPSVSAAVQSVAQNTANAESLAASLAGSAAAATTKPATDLTPALGARSRQYLYVWTGHDGRTEKDRLITMDFDPSSANYGKMVSQTLIDTSNNEPHHCGVTKDKTRLLCGGLLSVLKGQNEIFVFDIESDPANPKYIRSTKGKLGSIPDEFFPMNDGTFLLSEMGKYDGSSPGRMAKVDRDGNVLAEYPENAIPDFNPHGVQVREDLNLLVTCDYIEPSSSLNAMPGDVVLRSAARIWNLQEMKVINTIYFPTGAGTMDCKMYNKDTRGRGYAGGSGDGKVHQWDSASGTIREAIDLNKDVISWSFMRPFYTITAQYMSMSADDRFLYVPYVSANDRFTGKNGYYSGIMVYDVSDPMNARVIQNERFPSYAGPHLTHVMGNRLIATDYFLDQDDFGKIHLNGDHYVRAYTISGNGRIYPEPRFQISMNDIIPGIKLRPHGVAMKG